MCSFLVDNSRKHIKEKSVNRDVVAKIAHIKCFDDSNKNQKMLYWICHALMIKYTSKTIDMID